MASTRRQLALGGAVFLAYVTAAQLGFEAAFVAEQVTTVWAPTGIALAAFLLSGTRLWPAVWLGAFLANAATTAPLWTAPAVATGNTLEAVAAVWLLSRIAGFDPALRRARDAVAFILVAAALTPAISATIGVITLCAAGVQPWGRFTDLWWAWWLGDALGALIVGPAILTSVRWHVPARVRHWAPQCLLVIGSVAATHAVFGELFGPTAGHHPLEYVIFPFLITAAVRYGQPTTALVVFGGAAVAIGNTLRGSGPFADAELHQSLVLLQVFMGVVGGTGVVLAAAIAERETSERRRAAAHAVTETLAEAATLTEAAPAILRVICERLDWSSGAIWLIGDDERLRCLAVHAHLIPAESRFITVSSESRFPRGVGLPGRVWESGKAAWIENVLDDTNFPRASVARGAGLRGAFAFPICVGDELHGVIEFFNRSVESPDRALLETMSTVGSQIGQFIERKRLESAVAAAEQERDQLLSRELTARRDAEAANRAKDEFLATLSHELRTPLNASIGWTRMLLEGALDDQGRTRALEVIDRNAQLQARLVGDILDVSRIITGGLKLDIRPVDLVAVIASALDAVRPAADAKRIQLRSELAVDALPTEGDANRLQQVVWNLLANAVKFTPPGGVIDIELVETAHNNLRISVRDDGAGIDPEFLPHVFDRFRQADGSVSRQHGGLGLGLAIVRHLVELHGGRVRAESRGPGQGSSFVVELPRFEEMTN